MNRSPNIEYTPEELSNIRRAAEPYIDEFAKRLAYIYTIMPHPGYVINNGVLEPLPPLPEWQELIDKVVKTRDDTLKSNFPELYGN